MQFRDIPGLESLKEKLFRTVTSEKVAHAQMFAGPQGCANLALALAYATLLNCTNRTDNDSCGECPSCVKSNKLIHPDLHFVFPVSPTEKTTQKKLKPISNSYIQEWRSFVGKSPYLGTEEWSTEFGGENKQLNISREESRDIVTKLSLKPYEGKYKVMIIWLAEYMHNSAANALLKLFEEPPANTIFLLTTYDQEQIIGTILSRVQLLKIRRFKNPEVVDHLENKYDIHPDKAAQIASIAGGDMNHAINLMDDVEDDTHVMFQEWMRICFSRNLDNMVKWADDFNRSTKINQKGLFLYGMSVIRNALLIRNGSEDLVSVSIPEHKFIADFSKALSLDKMESVYKFLNTAHYHLERNANAKIVFLDTSFQIFTTFRK